VTSTSQEIWRRVSRSNKSKSRRLRYSVEKRSCNLAQPFLCIVAQTHIQPFGERVLIRLAHACRLVHPPMFFSCKVPWDGVVDDKGSCKSVASRAAKPVCKIRSGAMRGSSCEDEVKIVIKDSILLSSFYIWPQGCWLGIKTERNISLDHLNHLQIRTASIYCTLDFAAAYGRRCPEDRRQSLSRQYVRRLF